MALTPLRYEEILERMLTRCVARSALTDLADTAALKHVLAAAAREDDEQWYSIGRAQDLVDIDKVQGDDLDALVAPAVEAGFEARRTAQYASTTLQFGRAGIIGTVAIPVGTLAEVPAIGSTPARRFLTTASGSILAGLTTSAAIAARAEKAGSAYNVALGAVNSMPSAPSGVDTVTNLAAVTSGRARESDDEVRTRYRLWCRSLARSTTPSLAYAALLATLSTGEAVRYAETVEDPAVRGWVEVFCDDGAGTIETASPPVAVVGEVVLAAAVGGEEEVYLANNAVKAEASYTVRINAVVQVHGTDYWLNAATGQIVFATALTAGDVVDADYTHFTGLLKEAQDILDGKSADRVNYPGYIPAGSYVRAMPAAIRQILISANLTVLNGYVFATVAAAVLSAWSAYVNGQGLGQWVVVSELVARAKAVAGVFDVAISNPAENVAIGRKQLARLLASNVSIT